MTAGSKQKGLFNMKYALVYDANGSEQTFGYTDCLDLGQLLKLCENAISDGIDLFRIVVFRGRVGT